MPINPAANPVIVDASLPKRVRTLTWLAGLVLAMLLLLGITGMASETLMHITSPLNGQYLRFGTLPPFEESVVNVVWAMRPLIKLVHNYGGYVTVLLSGWAALQCISVAKTLAKSDDPKQRARGRWIGILGGPGGFLLALALLAQVACGTFMTWGVRALDDSYSSGSTSRTTDAHARDPLLSDARKEVFAAFHIRELNYPVGICALMLLLAMSAGRTAAVEFTKKLGKDAAEMKD